MITYCAHEVLKIGDDLYFCSSSTTDTYQYRNESGKIGVGAPFSYVPTEKAPYVINSVHTHTCCMYRYSNARHYMQNVQFPRGRSQPPYNLQLKADPQCILTFRIPPTVI